MREWTRTDRVSTRVAPTTRSVSVSPMSQAAQNLNWLITNFVDNTPGVSHTVVVSADGLLLAMSEGFPRDRADQLAAVASGLTSLTAGASRIFEGGAVNQTVVEMERGFLFIMSISDGSSLAVLAHPEADIGLVGYEMALLVDRAGNVLTPDLRAELQGSLLN
ncbi:Roadblock/LC7 family protein [Streptomyces clavuligerus]|uniref:Roadblock/LC7 family protein n=8 Tax=Streptomyces TaxID=1883 RepID=E2Q825_STRCL|nr:Roadblock/LC7 family protein [Streptomyces clavuligerus]